MSRRAIAFILVLLLIIPLSGCYNYRDLDEMNIVVGFAVDYDEETELFTTTFEIADLEDSDKKSSFKGRIIKAEGKTLVDCDWNARLKEYEELFFGAATIIVLSHQIAETMGVAPILDAFIRNGECRETLAVIISREDTASEVLELCGGTDQIISKIIHDIVREDSNESGATQNIKMYQLYDDINCPRNSGILPAVSILEEGEKKIPISDGVALLKGDKLIGYLSPEESKYLMYIEDRIKNGVLDLDMTGVRQCDTTLRVIQNKTTKSFSCEEDEITIHVKTETLSSIDEVLYEVDLLDFEAVKEIEAAAEKKLEENMLDLIHKTQHVFKTDVFGFGEMIYRKDLKLWKMLQASWEEIYPTLKIEVSSKMTAMSSGFIK